MAIQLRKIRKIVITEPATNDEKIEVFFQKGPGEYPQFFSEAYGVIKKKADDGSDNYDDTRTLAQLKTLIQTLIASQL